MTKALAESASELSTEAPLQTIIQLPSGAIAVKQSLKGRDFFKFQEMAGKDAAAALKWVVMKAFVVDGEALSIEQLEDEFSFEDAAMLSMEINKAFLPYLQAQTQ